MSGHHFPLLSTCYAPGSAIRLGDHQRQKRHPPLQLHRENLQATRVHTRTQTWSVNTPAPEPTLLPQGTGTPTGVSHRLQGRRALRNDPGQPLLFPEGKLRPREAEGLLQVTSGTKSTLGAAASWLQAQPSPSPQSPLDRRKETHRTSF